MAAEHVAVEVFISSEIDYRIKLISDCAECDLAPIRKETTSGSADRLWQAALNTQSKRFSVAAFENEKTVLADEMRRLIVRRRMEMTDTSKQAAASSAPAPAAPPDKRRYDRSIVEGPLRPAIWKIAWPTMLTNIIGGFQGIVDHAILVGHATRCALSVIRFKQGKWRSIAVDIEPKAKKSAS